MKKIKEFFNNIDWKDFKIGMVVYLIYFSVLWLYMCFSDTWDWFGKETFLFYLGGFFISGIINLIKQIK